MSHRQRHHASPQGVAPPDQIRHDFRVLDAHETLRTIWPNEQLILIQSVTGHAQAGDGTFQGRRFPNTTIDDVTRALRLDPGAVKQDHQDLIDAISRYVERALSGDPPDSLLDENSDPILGISTLRHIRVEPLDVLRGLYLGGLRDDVDVRIEIETQRGIKIGGGRAYLVDYEKMRQTGLTADELAHGEWERDIERFKLQGLIVVEDRRDDPNVVYTYIRYHRGSGASDDAAIVAAGLLWGFGATVGCFLADAIDTIEKYVPIYRDQDKELALRIEENWKAVDVTQQDVLNLTYLSWIPEDAGLDVPDSSLRAQLSIDRNVDLCPIEAHFLAAQGLPSPPLRLSHGRTSSHDFYEYIRRRVENLDGRANQ